MEGAVVVVVFVCVVSRRSMGDDSAVFICEHCSCARVDPPVLVVVYLTFSTARGLSPVLAQVSVDMSRYSELECK